MGIERRLLLGLIIGVSVVSAVIMLVKIREKNIEKQMIANLIQTLPNLPISDLDSTQTTLYQALVEQKPTLLLFFNPSCEHCQYEASEISKHLLAFENTNLVFISWESLQDIRVFRKQYFEGRHKPHCYKVELSVLSKTFGSLSVPCIYIYDSNKKLVKQYKGETKIELLMEHL
jgi:thiol-disulfide isomerase/thioredoxin